MVTKIEITPSNAFPGNVELKLFNCTKSVVILCRDTEEAFHVLENNQDSLKLLLQ